MDFFDQDECRVRREQLVRAMFPEGIPRLWCPPLTHFQADGQLDTERIRAHLSALAPFVKGILVPGSTGEGWDLSSGEVRCLLEQVLGMARELGMKVLIGVLHRQLADMLRTIDETVQWLADGRTGESALEPLLAAGVVGFTVCPPSGAELSQEDLRAGLTRVLERGYPTAIYQLPQVTGNEFSAETMAWLVALYPNFYLMKDTSGGDRVAMSGMDLGGVFLVRGAESHYAHWWKENGGPYDGMLLSTANCLARELTGVLELLTRGRLDEAVRLADRLDRLVQGCFAIVHGHAAANPFTNANKILDHIMAYGPDSLQRPAPFLHGGLSLPMEFVAQAFELTRDCGLLPEQGYLST